tara:strand:- start:833 stop:1186 length:354 start_codon:yes stop_codon:yes gene_type:complete
MNSCLEVVAENFKPYLLKDITIRTNKKVIRRGVLKIFQLKQYFIRLYLEVGDKTKQYEIPYPFTTHVTNDRLTLNYHLSTVMKGEDEILSTKLVDASNKSKIYNNLVYILTSADDEP